MREVEPQREASAACMPWGDDRGATRSIVRSAIMRRTASQRCRRPPSAAQLARARSWR
jgi:hypothetical protein